MKNNKELDPKTYNFENHTETIYKVFLTSLLDGSLDQEDIRVFIELYNHEWMKKNIFQAAVLFYNINSSSIIWKGVNSYNIIYAVYNISKEILEKNQLGTAAIYHHYVVLIYSCQINKEGNLNEIIDKNIIEIKEIIQKYLNITLSTGVGKAYKSLKNIHFSCKDAILALGDFNSENNINFISKAESIDKIIISWNKKKSEALIEAIWRGSYKDIEKQINLLLDEIKDTSFGIFNLYLMGVFLSILHQADKVGCVSKILQIGYPNFNIGLISKEWVSKAVKRACFILSDEIKHKQENKNPSLINKAVEYIEENYWKKDLTETKISQALHISGSYLRSILKKELNISFVNLLTRIRMKKARELLEQTNKKINEIASLVGYSNANYFSNCFFKYYKIRPNQMRKEYKQKNKKEIFK